MTDISRKFLAVSDETEECLKALVFAAMRAKAVSASLVILRCAENPGLGGWIASTLVKLGDLPLEFHPADDAD